MQKSTFVFPFALMLVAAAGLWLLGRSESFLGRVQAAGTQAPRFEVDPLWPKPLPNHWLMGQTIGVNVDAQDHIWIIHRAGSLEPGEQHAVANASGSKIAKCCAPAPPVLEFDTAGNLLASWGRVTIGPIPTTASRWITKATSGLAVTGAAPGGWKKARWAV
jgi:hypothetical protein